MKKIFGWLIIVVSIFWSLAIIMLYSDSFMNPIALLFNFVGCVFAIFFGIRIVSKKKSR